MSGIGLEFAIPNWLLAAKGPASTGPSAVASIPELMAGGAGVLAQNNPSIAPGLMDATFGANSPLQIPGLGPSMASAVPRGTPQASQGANWRDALAATATVQDMMLKQQAANRQPMVQAPAPRLDAPGPGRIPQLGVQIPRGPNPLQRHELLVRKKGPSVETVKKILKHLGY